MIRAAMCLSVGVSWAGMGAAQQLSLDEISSYLNGITTARTTFEQQNADFSLSTGQLFIKRPGRMRFEYDPPDSLLVVAGANAVVIEDRDSNTPPETYPLRRTPLAIILAREVDLSQADMVVAHDYDGVMTRVTAQDPENPEYGSIDLWFSAEPTALREWVIHDGAGSSTRVVLDELVRGGTLPNRLFDTSREGSGRD